jgi:hypothetical protein
MTTIARRAIALAVAVDVPQDREQPRLDVRARLKRARGT